MGGRGREGGSRAKPGNKPHEWPGRVGPVGPRSEAGT